MLRGDASVCRIGCDARASGANPSFNPAVVLSELASANNRLLYAYKASLIGSAYRFELGDDELQWQVGGRSGTWTLSSISMVRLSYRPVSMQSRRFRTDIWNERGERISILSTTWQTVALMEPQDNSYRQFVLALHGRLKTTGSTATFVAGLSPWIYQTGLGVLALVAVAIAGMFLRAAWTGLWAGAAFLVAFAALFVWQVGGFMRRNRPRSYSADDVPGDLIP